MKHTPFACLGLLLLIAPTPGGEKERKPITHQITGLFCPERETALREAFAKIPQVKLVGIDFKKAEAQLDYDPAKAFPGAKPEQIVQTLDNLLHGASNHTLGVKPLSKVPADKLQYLEIPVAGLDCLACSFGAYDAIYRLEGVERATASFRTGKVTAWIDPAKTDRAKLETALKQRGVTLPKAAAPPS